MVGASPGCWASVNIVGGAGLRARQYGPLAATEGRPTGLPTFLPPTPGCSQNLNTLGKLIRLSYEWRFTRVSRGIERSG